MKCPSMMNTPNRTSIPAANIRRDKSAPLSRALVVAAGLGAVALFAGSPMTALAQTRTAAVAAKPVDTGPATTSPEITSKPVAKLAGRYFVDFRARTAASYGHAFLWYGRLNAHGKVGNIEVAGLHPATDSVIPYILGHIIPVPSETVKS